MRKLTIDDTDRIILNLLKLVESDKDLQKGLETAKDGQSRWVALETCVLEHLSDVGTNAVQYDGLWLRERFFYEIQKKSGMDYGFCEFFIPAFRNRTLSILTNDLTLDLDHKCMYNSKTQVMTICNGTERDICGYLHPHLQEHRNKLIEDYADQLAGQIARNRKIGPLN